jgi:uncharacterized protein YecE (DUF72 family)
MGRRASATTEIGTSGWNYDHWKGPFYPEDVSQRDWLEFYSRQLHTVEVNNTFYSLPERSTFEAWSSATPRDFLFSVKASRYITHMKKLKDPDESLERLFNRITTLKSKLGPVLFQLPPRWKSNPERLETFLQHLPKRRRYAMEFRDESWWNEEVLGLLADRNIAFCIFELDGRESPREITADFVYIRLHGPEGAYEGQYSKQTLSGWAGAIAAWKEKGLDIYCYFDNDQNGYAAINAVELREMVTEA